MTTAAPAPTGGRVPASGGTPGKGRGRTDVPRDRAGVLLAVAVVFVLENRQLNKIRLLMPFMLMPFGRH